MRSHYILVLLAILAISCVFATPSNSVNGTGVNDNPNGNTEDNSQQNQGNNNQVNSTLPEPENINNATGKCGENCSECVEDNGRYWCFVCKEPLFWTQFTCVDACPLGTKAYYGEQICEEDVEYCKTHDCCLNNGTEYCDFIHSQQNNTSGNNNGQGNNNGNGADGESSNGQGQGQNNGTSTNFTEEMFNEVNPCGCADRCAVGAATCLVRGGQSFAFTCKSGYEWSKFECLRTCPSDTQRNVLGYCIPKFFISYGNKTIDLSDTAAQAANTTTGKAVINAVNTTANQSAGQSAGQTATNAANAAVNAANAAAGQGNANQLNSSGLAEKIGELATQNAGLLGGVVLATVGVLAVGVAVLA